MTKLLYQKSFFKNSFHINLNLSVFASSVLFTCTRRIVAKLVRPWVMISLFLSVSARWSRRSGNQRRRWEEGRNRFNGTCRSARISRKQWVARATRYPRVPRKTGKCCSVHRITHSRGRTDRRQQLSEHQIMSKMMSMSML